MNEFQKDRAGKLVFRSVLVTVVMVVALVSATAGAAAAGATAPPPEDDEYSVIQGEDCFTIDPLGEGYQSSEAFYDYRTPNTSPSSYSYSSHGTTQLQEADTSSVFLHDGSDGLSLVFLHNQYDGGSSGGAVTMQLNDLPEDGDWVVEDDGYDGADDEFVSQETSSRITWVGAGNRTDGGVFNGGLDDEFQIEIVPAFNDEADFQLYDGEITDWQAISAADDGHERMSLDMTEPIVIQSGDCEFVDVTDVTVDETATVGESIAVETTAENDGVNEETATVTVTVDGEPVDEQALTLDPGETTTLTTALSFDETGTYTVDVGGETANVTVEAEANENDASADDQPGFGVTAVALTALLVAVIARRRL